MRTTALLSDFSSAYKLSFSPEINFTFKMSLKKANNKFIEKWFE